MTVLCSKCRDSLFPLDLWQSWTKLYNFLELLALEENITIETRDAMQQELLFFKRFADDEEMGNYEIAKFCENKIKSGEPCPGCGCDPNKNAYITDRLKKAEDLLSIFLANEESRYREARKRGNYFSIHTLNKLRCYWNQEEVELIDPDNIKGEDVKNESDAI